MTVDQRITPHSTVEGDVIAVPAFTGFYGASRGKKFQFFSGWRSFKNNAQSLLIA